MKARSIPESNLLIISNRLPVVLQRTIDNGWTVQPGSGGLVTALAPVLRNRGGTWIGWPGIVSGEAMDLEQVLADKKKSLGYSLKAVNITRSEKENYYQGFANEVIWPLFHDFIAYCNFKPDYWVAYQKVNQKFAEATIQNLNDDSFIWVHDYHLMGLATALRRQNVHNRIGFFLHIPFPPPDIFIRLPWRFQILEALLDFDLIGFQTVRDRRNFLQCVRMFIENYHISGKGQVIRLQNNQREIRAGIFPISIDFREFANLAASKEVADRSWYIHEYFSNRKIIFGIDRLDYSKGIPERLRAFRYALRHYRDLQEKISLIQVVVPSRREISRYADLKMEIERLVGEINGQFTRPGWVPVHYMFTSLKRTELVSYYRTSDIALITPLKDGMNLVAKEYCASNIDENGVLITSEFAGAAAQFQRQAILVNPHDIEGMAGAIHRAFSLSPDERRQRMKKLRHLVSKFDIFWWVDSFLQAAIEKHLDNFPVLDDYFPRPEDESFKGIFDEI